MGPIAPIAHLEQVRPRFASTQARCGAYDVVSELIASSQRYRAPRTALVPLSDSGTSATRSNTSAPEVCHEPCAEVDGTM
jgi:hypothetical protein